MSSIQRFEAKEQDGGTRLSLLMEPNPNGRWVRYEVAERYRSALEDIIQLQPMWEGGVCRPSLSVLDAMIADLKSLACNALKGSDPVAQGAE